MEDRKRARQFSSAISDLEAVAKENERIYGKGSPVGDRNKNIDIVGGLRITRVAMDDAGLRRLRTSFHRLNEVIPDDRAKIAEKASGLGIDFTVAWIANTLLANGATLPGTQDSPPKMMQTAPFQRGMVYYVPTTPGGYIPSNVYYQIDGLDSGTKDRSSPMQRAVYNVIVQNPPALSQATYEGQTDFSKKPKARGVESSEVPEEVPVPAVPTSDIQGTLARLKAFEKAAPGSLAKIMPSIKFAAERGMTPSSIKSQFPGFGQADFQALLDAMK